MLNKQQNGFTLIELMVSILIGLFLLAGTFTIYLNSRESQRVIDEEVRMMDNARFALESIAFDLRHAGGYGHHNHEGQANVRDEEKFTTVTGQCGVADSGWVVDLNRPVFAVDDATDYSPGCMGDWVSGDTLEMRYGVALPVGIDETTDLSANLLYLKSVADYAYMFKGSALPSATQFNDKPNVRFFIWQARGYYIANHTDTAGDGVPSLRLVSLEPGPTVSETVLLRGVEDLQVKIGLDIPLLGETQGDESVDAYKNPSDVSAWNQAIAARIWLVVRSENEFPDIAKNTPYEVAGVVKTFDDQYKRIVVSATVRLRNANTGDI